MADFIYIDSIDDPRIEPYRNLRDRDLRDLHGGRFVAEGESVIKVLLAGALHPPESVMVADGRVAALGSLLVRTSAPVYVLPQALMDGIVGFNIHRGLLAIGKRGEAIDPAALLGALPSPVVALAGIANHDNVGGIFRNAAAFGAGAVVYDRATADPFYRKALRVSVGGVLKVPKACFEDAASMVGALTHAGYRVIGLAPRGRITLGEVPRDRPLALLLGTEGPGLPDHLLAATLSVRIDMTAGFDSLNVATTSGIALYELTKRG